MANGDGVSVNANGFVETTEYLKAVLASGRSIVLPCEIVDSERERVVGSRGDHPFDRIEVRVAGEIMWVERRDLCTGGRRVDLVGSFGSMNEGR